MKNLIQFILFPQGVEEFFLKITIILTLLGAMAAACKFYFDLRGLLEDVKNRFTGKVPYRVMRTIIKTISKDNQTQTIKLHTLRVFKDMNSIEIDPSPQITDQDDKRFINISHRYSIPGRIQERPERRLRIDFKEDEKPRARHDYTYVTSHTANETMQDLLGNPGIVVSQPVGRDSLVVEFFFPPKWHYRRNADDRPLIKVYTTKVPGSTKEEDREYVPPERIFAEGGFFTFDLTEGDIDWLRITVKKPPQNFDINVDWFWDDATQEYYLRLEEAKSAARTAPPKRVREPEKLEQGQAAGA